MLHDPTTDINPLTARVYNVVKWEELTIGKGGKITYPTIFIIQKKTTELNITKHGNKVFL